MKQAKFAPGSWRARDVVAEGDVEIGPQSSIWFHTTIRAELAPVRIGAQSNIQDNCVLHVDAGSPLTIGDRVTVGHGAILHGCTIGDETLIGMGSIVMNGARIGRHCIIGAGALVTQNTVIPDGMMAYGAPAAVVRALTEAEIATNLDAAREYMDYAPGYVRADLMIEEGGDD
ncbi:MAG: gamma carbonic anhydrase family protein [Oscillospiraceae bacterium]|nr:gamma carbonic anhydrase family protein [Oscillospiraceae bacterium]